MTKFSIVMPTFNSEQYVSEAIESVLSQDCSNLELLICDGGSQDGTIQAIEKIKDGRMRLVSRKDSGVADALNTGFKHAKGEIFSWLNSDDLYCRKDALTVVKEAMAERPERDFAYGHHNVISLGGEIKKRLYAYRPYPGFDHYGANIFTGALFFRREAWSAWGGFSTNYEFAFEYELVKNLFDHGKPILIDQFLASFRIRPGALSSIHGGRMDSEKREIYSGRRYHSEVVRLCARLGAQLRDGTLYPAVVNRLKK